MEKPKPCYSQSIHKPPASIRFRPMKHPLAVSVELYKFSPDSRWFMSWVRVDFDVLMKENLSTLTRVRNLFMIGHSNRDELGLKIFQYNFFCHRLHKK